MFNLNRAEDFLSRLPIRDKLSQRLIPFILNPSQRKVHAALKKQHEAGRPMRAVTLKARRQGISTYTDALLATHCAAKSGVNSLITTHDFKSSKELFKTPKTLVTESLIGQKTLKSVLNLQAMTQHKITFPHSTGDSFLSIATAGNVEGGRGMSLTDLHCCLTGDSLVAVEDGNFIPIRSCTPIKDSVWTHTGWHIAINGVSKRPADDRKVVRVRTWMNCDTVGCTEDHKFWTSRGWVPAGELTDKDELGTAIRQLSGLKDHIDLPEIRDSWGRLKRGKMVDLKVPLSWGFGYFCGYYLAEGYLGRNHGKAAQVSFAHHIEEFSYASRAARCVEKYSSSFYSKVRIGTNTGITTVYGSALARWVEQELGTCGGKRVPDWVFDTNSDFIRGLVVGYFTGDGSKGIEDNGIYRNPSVSATSVCPGILHQIRHLLASLGWGWGGIGKKTAKKDERGWKIRDAWILSVNGLCAIRLRHEIGINNVYVPKEKEKFHTRALKYRLDGGWVWTKVRSITPDLAEEIWDIEVDHPDHSFETPIGAVANSEAAFYPGSGTFAALLPTVPRSADTIIVVETTANGRTGIGEVFYEFWNASVRGDTEFTPIFLSWLIDPTCVDYDHPVPDAPKDDDERLLMIEGINIDGNLIKATPQQIAWRRMTIDSPACRGYVEIFDQEFPVTPDVAFISTGEPAFTREEMAIARNSIQPYKKVEIAGEVSSGTSSSHIYCKPNDVSPVLQWEPPIKDHRYYFGVDAARGKDEGDFAAIVGLDGETGNQVLRYAQRVDPEYLARLCHYIGHYYNRGMLCIELTGNLGLWCQMRLRDYFHYPNLYRWRGTRDDKIAPGYSAGKRGGSYGWETTYRSRERLLITFRESIVHRMCTVRDEEVVRQMDVATRKDSWERWEIAFGHDDILMAYMLANVARSEWHPRKLEGATSSLSTDADQDSRALQKLNPQMTFEHLGSVTAGVYKQLLRDRDRYDREEEQKKRGWR
jgi:hypothetical protein